MALGDIGAIIDTLTVDAAFLNFPSMCHVSGTIYVTAYRGADIDGYIKTVDIANNGQIQDAVIDTYEFDAVHGIYPFILKVHETTYIIAYKDTNNDGKFVTVTIANDGTITKAILDSLIFEAGDAYPSSFIQLTSNYFAVAYGDAANHGWIKTVYAANDGTLPAAVTSSWEFDAVRGLEPSLIHIANLVHAVAYQGPDIDGFILTFPISLTGIIGAQIDSLEFHPDHALATPVIVRARDTFYAIAHQGPGFDGFLKILDIADDGTIENAVVDDYEFDVAHCYYPCILSTGEPYLAVAYRGLNNHGYLKTFSLDAAGSLNNTTLDTLQFYANACYRPCFFHIDGDTFSILYGNVAPIGILITVPIETYWPPSFILSGTVKQKAIAVQRILRAYTRATGILYSSTTSAEDGTFTLPAPDTTTEMFVIAFDDDAGEDYNALIYSRVKGVPA